MKRQRRWVLGFLIASAFLLSLAAGLTIWTDPYMHFHAPNIDRFYYRLDNERSQNDGILRHFDYEGLITGTSMVQNTKASEAEALFGMPFVKACYEGGTFYEINQAIATAAAHNDQLKMVIRGLDMDMFFDEKDRLRTDLGEYPFYLYDDSPWNDVRYLWNRDVLFSRALPMLAESLPPGHSCGMTSFDEYGNWMREFQFGAHAVHPEGLEIAEPAEKRELTEAEAQRIRENIRQNVTALAEQYPQIVFYCFIEPYSAAWWQAWYAAGGLEYKVEAERIVIEEILQCENIRLFSFNDRAEITANLNFYKDMDHYGEWINSLILGCMHEGKGLLTRENYQAYLESVLQLYGTYDYTRLIQQGDFQRDEEAAELVSQMMQAEDMMW